MIDPPTRPNPHATEPGGGPLTWAVYIAFGIALAVLTLVGLLYP